MRFRETSKVAVALALTALVSCQKSERDSSCDFTLDEGPTAYVGLSGRTPREAQIEAARTSSEFKIGQQTVKLVPPVDWTMDPLKDRSWRFWLHTLIALEPLLYQHAQTGDPKLLRQAVDLTLDWVRQNPRSKKGVSEFAWYDMAVGYRAAYLGYMVQATSADSGFSDEERKALRCAAVEHAAWLNDDANYKAGHNHGLYEDAGLFVLASRLTGHPSADKWREHAEERFLQTVEATVSVQEGFHLEHSPSYHAVVANLVRRLREETQIGGERLDTIVTRMEAVAAWFLMPDGRYAQLGDTDLEEVPEWVASRSDSAQGFGFFRETGLAVYRTAESYFAMTAWYHARSHKHADELSVVWAGSKRRILVDAGRYGYYYEEPGRLYAESSPGHNGVSFGAQPFEWRATAPYGSALRSSDASGPWRAVLATNPLALAQNEVSHTRIAVYRPEGPLILVDVIDAATCSDSTRYLHFAPDLQLVNATGGSAHLKDAVGDVYVRALDPGADIEHVRGRREPPQGFTFPGVRDWVANEAILVHSSQCRSPLVTVLSESEPTGLSADSSEPSAVVLTVGTERISVRWSQDVVRLSVAPLP